jgi:hypothetical protein
VKAEEIPGLYGSRQIFIDNTSSGGIHLTGLTGSAASVFAAAHHKNLTSPVLFILPRQRIGSLFSG